MLLSTPQGGEMGTGPEGHECRGGEGGGARMKQEKPPRNQAFIPDKSQQGVSVLTVWMILQVDPFLCPRGSICNLGGETE